MGVYYFFLCKLYCFFFLFQQDFRKMYKALKGSETFERFMLDERLWPFQLYSSLLLNAFYFSNECHLWFAKLIHLEEIMIHFVYIIKISFNL